MSDLQRKFEHFGRQALTLFRFVRLDSKQVLILPLEKGALIPMRRDFKIPRHQNATPFYERGNQDLVDKCVENPVGNLFTKV